MTDSRDLDQARICIPGMTPVDGGTLCRLLHLLDFHNCRIGAMVVLPPGTVVRVIVIIHANLLAYNQVS
jgi:hypothetical protein